jgi:hypothetical protein
MRQARGPVRLQRGSQVLLSWATAVGHRISPVGQVAVSDR